MFQDKITFTGVVTICVTDSDGVLKEKHTIKNLVVDAGKEWVTARMAGAAAAMSHMAVGTGVVAAVVGNTTLGTELARTALVSTTALANKVTYIASFPAGMATGALTEAGIFNAPTLATMLARTTFPVINKGANDGISITWEVTTS